MGGRSRLIGRIAMIAGALGLATPAPADGPVTTVLTHGYSLDSSKGPWVEAMGFAVLSRAGGGAIFRYDQDISAWRLVEGRPDDGAAVVLVFRWTDDFTKPGAAWGYAEAAGDALVAALRAPLFVDGAGVPIAGVELVSGRDLHFVGHSRGAVVNSEAVRRLGRSGIAVDHVTSLDPHPVNGTLDEPFDFDWGDPVPRTWSNVVHADNFYRADGGFVNAADFDGIPIEGAVNTELDESALNCCAYGFAHSDVHLWYHGTIDLLPGACDGEACINQTMRDTWWPDGDAVSGFYFARLGGGAEQRPPLPGPTTAPGEFTRVIGGDFAGASFAGWRYHGGGGDGVIVSADGDSVMRLEATGGSATERHNRAMIEGGDGAVRFRYRSLTAAPGAVLAVDLLGSDGAWPAGFIDLDGDGAWIDDVVLALPEGLPRPAAYNLAFTLQSPGGTSILDFDDVDLVPLECLADATGDGTVDVSDLIAVITSWGPCGTACPADIDGDGTVGVGDLVAVILAFGPCA